MDGFEPGTVYGQLTVVKDLGALVDRRGRHRRYILCQCSCGGDPYPVLHFCLAARRQRQGITKCRKCRCKAYGESALHQLYVIYRRGARVRGLDFKLSKEEFRSLTSKNCIYCGSPPSNRYKPKHTNGEYTYNGIDRVDNSTGYSIDNCIPCCFPCNKMKRAQNVLAWLAHVEKIYLHLNNNECFS